MSVIVFGENAGLIWNALSDGNRKTTKELKKIAKLTDKELYAALGWLARENKICIVEEDADILVQLV